MEKRKKLVIISHTEHFLDGNTLKGWGPTVNEINYLSNFWEEVVHIGCLYQSTSPQSALEYTNQNIRFDAIPSYGGKSILDKIRIFLIIPFVIWKVYNNIKNASEVQLRLPTAIGIFLLPFFTFHFFRKYTLWVKYAGAWDLKSVPFSYRLQRFWLRNNFQRSKVTINGTWNSQPSHCISFENPCLSQKDLSEGLLSVYEKQFSPPFTFCFVGRVEKAKGIDLVLDALSKIPSNLIESIHIVGDGQDVDLVLEKSSVFENKIYLHGFLPTCKVHQLLAKSHFFLLPSRSEGFPKALAEASCYGVIPFVSNVGSIAQYINPSNGFLWEISTAESFPNFFKRIFTALESRQLSIYSKNLHKLSEKFTFEKYLKNLEKYIFIS